LAAIGTRSSACYFAVQSLQPSARAPTGNERISAKTGMLSTLRGLGRAASRGKQAEFAGRGSGFGFRVQESGEVPAETGGLPPVVGSWPLTTRYSISIDTCEIMITISTA
jgi:hypothetical protein